MFSKLSTPLKVESLELKFNLGSLDQTINFVSTSGQPFSLKKQSPITLERDIYVDQENSQMEFIVLNQIKMKVSGPQHVDLQFIFAPFLAPTEAEEQK